MSDKNPFDSDEDLSKNENPTCNSTDMIRSESQTGRQGMIVEPACVCSKCNYWTNSSDWCPPNEHKVESNISKTRNVQKQPLLISDPHCQKSRKILWYNPNQITKVERQTLSKTLVHGEAIPDPVKFVTETYFSKDVQSSLEILKYRCSLPLQSFSWPAIFRHMNVLLIGGQKKGKTMGYLPAICTFSTAEEMKYQELLKYKGPLVVIICSNSNQCEEIYDLIKTLYEKNQHRPKVAIVTYPVSHVPSADILITIADSLIHCLKTKIFNFKRLCHLVLEDASGLLKNQKSSIYKILEVANDMLDHRLYSARVQLIVTSQKWTSDLKELLHSVYIPPLVCIENPLEAALYGNIQLEIKFLNQNHKMEYLAGVLQNEYRVYKTLVICHQSEITDLNKFLLEKDIETIALTDSLSKEEIDEYEVEWNFMQGGKNKVLLCSDFIFDSLLFINDAMWLISYSFSTTWTRFTRRFGALSSHFKSPLESNEDTIRCKSLILIDETSEKEMPKIMKLLSRLTKDLPKYQEYVEDFKQQNEHKKLDTGVVLCDTLKLFGKCSNSSCEKRHVVRESDMSNDLPKSGKVVFRILNLKDVTQCTVQLMRHIDLQGCVDIINDDDLKNPLDYKGQTKIQVTEAVVGKFYAHCDYTQNEEVYTLCHVLKVDKQSVEVKLITGRTMVTFRAKLFEIPAHIKIVDVYLCNLIPPFRDEMFSGRSFYVARTSLENVEFKKMILTGSIFLQLDNTLWLDNVVQMFHVEGIDVIKFNLIKHLMNLGVVESCQGQIRCLHKLCKRCNVFLPSYVKTVAKKSVRSIDVEPQMAFLTDNTTEVILSSAVNPNEFYVRLTKFQPLLDALEKDIQTTVRTEILDKNINIEIGKYYLALDPKGQWYSRVKILNAKDDKALCFYVDYGDEALVDICSLKILPTKFITRLPFQAIQCRLYGLSPAFGEWNDESTDILYNYMFEPESDVFRSLFVEARGEDNSDMLRVKKKYSVLLKDGYGEKNILINQLLLDCGFATTIFTKLDDFEIPIRKVVESDSEESTHEEEEMIEDDVGEFLENDFDFNLNNAEEFMKILGISNLNHFIQRQPTLPALEENKTQTNANDHKQVCKNQKEENQYFTPDVYWSQTDKIVKMKIKLIGVEKYKLSLLQNRIFSFSTFLDKKEYQLKFRMYKRVKISKDCARGQEVQVVFNKIDAVEWLQLTTMTKRLRNVHYEIPDSQLEEPKKKFLQLDITDDESDADDPNGPMYHNISDMDSEFDQEFSPSSGDE